METFEIAFFLLLVISVLAVVRFMKRPQNSKIPAPAVEDAPGGQVIIPNNKEEFFEWVRQQKSKAEEKLINLQNAVIEDQQRLIPKDPLKRINCKNCGAPRSAHQPCEYCGS